jgi:hypothetical protein
MTKLASILLSGFALTLTVAPALASSTAFAGYIQANGTQDLALTSTQLTGNNYSVTITASDQVNFFYKVGGTPFSTTQESATLNLNVTSTFAGNCSSDANCGAGGSYTQTGYSGSFSILLNTPFGVLRNLLSGTFSQLPSGNPNFLLSGAQLTGAIGSSQNGALEGTTTSANPNQVMFTSDFLSFADTLTRDATFSLSSLSPIFSVIGNTGIGFPTTFHAIGAGNFFESAIVEVPEPSTLALLLASGLLCLCLWQRKRRQLHR